MKKGVSHILICCRRAYYFSFSGEGAVQEKLEEMAPAGQTDLHFPQRMHSGLLICLVTSTAMGQERSHFLQPIHLDSFKCIR